MSTNLPDNQKTVSISEAAEILGVSLDTLRRWDKEGTVHAIRGDDNKRYFSLKDIEDIKFKHPLSISQAAEMLKVSPSTLRRLEKRGLINPKRNDGGERTYDRAALEKILQSEYFLHQKEVEEKVIEPLLPPKTTDKVSNADVSAEKPREIVQTKVIGAVVTEHDMYITRLMHFRKMFFTAGYLTAMIFIFLIALITILFLIFPDDTAKFFGLGRNRILAQQSSGLVLGAKYPTDALGAKTETSTLGKALKPFGNVALGVVEQINPETYEKIVPKKPIEDVNDVFEIDDSGSIRPYYNLTFPDTSYLIIPDKGLIKNLNAEFVQGRVPGNSEGNLAVYGKDGTITGLRVGKANIANFSVNSADIADGSVTSLDLGDGSVTSTELLDGAIVTVDLADGSVTTAKLVDSAITSAKIADGAISNSDISDSAAIGDSKLAQITAGDKVAGSAVQLSSTGGLVNASGLSLTRTCSSGQVLSWNGSAWACADQSTGTGDITAVFAGDGLTGGATSGDATLNIGAGAGIAVTSDSISATLGTSVDLASEVTGTLPVANGGTNATTIGSAGSIAYSTGTAYGFSSVGTSGQCLVSGGTGTPTWGTCGSSGVTSLNSLTGALNIAGGGINTVSAAGSTITVTATEADTLASVTGRGATTSTSVALNGGITSSSSTPLTFSSTSPSISIGNTGTLTITDGSNTLLSLADNGTTGTLSVNAVTVSGLGSGVVKSNGSGVLSSSTVALGSEVSGQLPLANGGTNASLTAVAGGIVYSGGSALAISTAGTTGQCLVSGGTGTPTWGTCGGGGVTSLDGLTGALTLANSSGTGSTITIDNAAADGTTKGIAAFNSTNFTASSGVVNTVQNIHAAAAPTFAGVTFTNTSNQIVLGTTNTTTISSVAPSASRVATIPALTANDTFVFENQAQTLTNKTISGSSNTISNIGNSSLTNSSITFAGDTGSSATSLGGTRTITGGTGLASTDNGSGTLSLSVGAGDGITAGADSISVDTTTTGTTLITASNSGLETTSSGVRLLGGCSANQILKWNSVSGAWVCSTDTGGLAVEEGDSTISANASTLDFLGADFTVTDSPSGEANIAIDYANSAITRSTQAESITGAWTLRDSVVSFVDNADATKQLKFELSGLTTGTTRTLTAPDVNGTLITTGNLSAITSVGTVTSGTWNGSTIAVPYGGTGATTFTTNGLLYGNGTGAVQNTAAGTSGQLLVANASGVPTFVTVSADATLAASGALTIAADAVALGTDTTGNYVATLTSGNGISSSATGEGSTPTVSLAALTADWDQTGAFDISLNNSSSELKMLESGLTPTFFGIFDVTDLSADRIYTFPNASGEVSVLGQTISNAELENSTVSYGGISLALGGSDATPAFNLVDATGLPIDAGTTGTLPIARGGTNSTATPTAGGVTYGTGTAYAFTAAGTSGQCLTSAGAGTPTWGTCGSGDITSVGDVTSGAAFDGTQGNSLQFEGSTADGFETTLTAADPGADFTITLPALTGTVALLEGTQTFSGAKTFSATSTFDGAIAANGNVTLGNATTDRLTVTSQLLGASPLVFQGATDDTITTTLAFTDPATSSKTITFPNATGTVAVSATGPIALSALGDITCATCLTSTGGGTFALTLSGSAGTPQTINAGDTISIAAGTGITTTAGATDTVTIAATLGTSVDLASEVTGILPLANGGTNANLSAVNGGIVYSGASSLAVSAAGTSGQCLTSGGAGAPTWAACGGAGDISSVGDVTSGAAFDGTQGNALQFEGSSADDFETTLTAANPGADFTITLPGITGTVALLEGAQTFSGAKTFSDLTISDTVIPFTGGNTDLDIQGGTTRTLSLYNSTTAQVADLDLSDGSLKTAGTTRLTNGGTLQNVTYNGSTVGTAYGGTNATTIGSAGSVAYSTGTAYAFSAAGTSGQCLTSGGAGTPTWGSCGSGGSASAWSAITDPTGNLALSMGANTTSFSFNAATGTNNLFTFIDTTNNTGTGYIMNIETASGSNAKPLRVVARGSTIIDTTAAGALTLGLSGQSITFAAPSTFNENITIAANKNLTLSSGTGVISQTFSNAAASSADSRIITNANTGLSATAINGLDFSLSNATNTNNTNTLNGIHFNAASNNNSNIINGIQFASATGFTNFLDTPSVDISSGGAISGATGLTSSGAVTFSGLNTAGAVVYTNGSGVLGVSGQGSANQCLLSGGAGTPTWGSCAAGSTSASWSSLTAPSANLAINHAEFTSAFTWDTAATAAGFDALTLALTNDAAADSTTQRVVVIRNNAVSGGGTTEGLLRLDHADIDSTLSSGVAVLSSGGQSITTAFDASDGAIFNALNIGPNRIVGTTGTIDLDNFDVSETGTVTIADAQSYTGINNVTLSSGGGGNLFLNSSSNTLFIHATDTALSATGLNTITSSTSLSLNPNTGTSYTLNTSATTLDLFNTTPTAVNFAGGATTALNIGSTTTGVNTFNADVDMIFAGSENLSITNTTLNSASDTVSIAQTLTGDVSSDGLSITVTDNNASAVTGTNYGFNLANADNSTNTSVIDALALFSNDQATETLADGVIIRHNAASGTLTDALQIQNTTAGGTITNAINILNTAGTVSNGIVMNGAIGTGIDLSGASSTTDLIFDDGLTMSQTSDNDLDLVEGGQTLNVNFNETEASAIVFSSASELAFTSTSGSADGIDITSSGGGIDITASGNADGEDIDITATGATTEIRLTTASTQADALRFNATAGGIDIDATNSTINISNATDSAGDDLTLAITGATDSSIILSSSGTGTDAIKLNVTGSGGDIDIDANDAITIDAGAGGMTFTANEISGTGAASAFVFQDLSSSLTSGTGLFINVTPDTGTSVDIDSNSLTTGTGFDVSSTGTIVTGGDLVVLTANSATTGNLANLSATGLTTGNGLTMSLGTALTTGSGLNITGASYNPGASNTGNLVNLSLTHAGSNTTGNSIVDGINIASTINTSGATGTKEMNAIHIAAPTVTACTGGNCTWSGVEINTLTTGALSNLTSNGLLINATGIGAGTLNGINISSITPGAGNEAAITVGTGWDSILDFATSADFDIADNTVGAFTITEGANTYFLITTTDNNEVVTLDLPTGGATSLTGNLFTSDLTKTINIGTGTANDTINLGDGAGTNVIDIGGVTSDGNDTINIGTNGTTDDDINIGNNGGATALNIKSGTGSQTYTSNVATGTTTTSAFVFTDNASSLTSGTGLYVNVTPDSGKSVHIDSDSLTTGVALDIESSSAVSTNADLIQADHSATYASTTTVSGNILDLTRNLTADSGVNPAITLTVNSPLATISDNCATGAGDTCTHSGDVLFLDQNYAASTGNVLNIDTESTGGNALNITSAATTGNALNIDTEAIFTNEVIDINVGAQAATGDVLNISMGATAVGAQALVIGNSSSIRTASMIEVNDNNTTGTVATFDLNLASTRGGLFDIDSTGALGTENLIDIDTSGAFSSNLLDITTTVASSGNLIDLNFGNVADTGDALNISMGASAVGAQGLVMTTSAGARTQSAIQITENNTTGSVPTIQWDSAETRGGLLDANLTGALGTENFIDITTSAAFTSNLLDVNIGANAATGDVVNLSMGSTALSAGAFVIADAGGARTDALVDINSASTGDGTDASSLFQINSTGALLANSNIFDINSTAAGASNALDITYSTAANTGNAIDLNMGTNVAGDGLNIATAATTGQAIQIDTSGVFTGSLVDINIGAQAATGDVLNIDLGTTAVQTEAIVLTSGGVRTASMIDINENNTTGSVPTIQWDSAETRGGLLDANLTGALGTENFINIDASAAFTSNLLDINTTAASSGNIIDITTGTAASSGNLIDLNFGNVADTGDALNISMGASAVGAQGLVMTTSAGARTQSAIQITENNTTGSVPTIQWDSAETRGGLLDANLTGALGTENFIDVTASGAFTTNLIDLNSTSTGSGNMLDITFATAAGTGNALDVNMGTNVAGDGLNINSAATTGQAIEVVSTAATTGNIIDVSSSSIAATSSDLMQADHTATYTTTNTVSGNILDLSRSLTANDGTAGAITLTVNSPVLNIADNCAVGAADICTHSGNVLSLTQSFGSATGAVLNMANAGTGQGLLLTSSSTGVLAQLDITGTGTTADGVLIRQNGSGGTLTDAIEITNTAGNITNAINIADTTGGTITTGINISAGTLTTGIDLSGASTTTDIILDDGLTISQTADNILDISENSRTLTFDFSEVAGTIKQESASKIEIESTADGADALVINSTAGGIDILASGAGAGEDIDITATGSSINLTSTEAVSDAIVLAASTEAGGLRFSAGDNPATVLANGNDIELRAEDDTIVALTAAGQLIVDAATNVDSTVNGATTGMVNIALDAGSVTASQIQNGIYLDFETIDDATANQTHRAFRIDFTNSSVDDETAHALSVNNANAAGAATDGLITLEDNDASTVVGAGLLFLAGDNTNSDFTYGIDLDAADIGTADIRFENSGTLDEGTAGTWTFDRSAAGTVTIQATDDDANTALTISSSGTGILTLDPTGAGSIVVGSADVTAMTFTTDNNAINDIAFTGGVQFNNVATIGDGSGNDYLSFTEEAGNPTCGAGDYKIWANSTGGENKLKKCQNGALSDLDAAGAWNALTSPTGNTALDHQAFSTTFDWSSTNGLNAWTFDLNNTSTSATSQSLMVLNNAQVDTANTDNNTENILLLQQLDTATGDSNIVDNALKIDSAGASNITDAIEITNSAGDITNGINIVDSATAGLDITTGIAMSGTFTNYIDTPNFDVSNAGVVTLQGAQAADITTQSNNGLTVTPGGTGALTLNSANNAANAIYLRANGGTSETIKIHADQGTGVASLDLLSDVGGISLTAGLATADAININASNAAGGIDIDSGTGGIIADTTGLISFDSTNAGNSNFTVTAANADLTLAAAGGGTNQVIISSAGTSASAIDLNASGIVAGNAITIDATDGGISLDANGSANGDITIDAADTLTLAGSSEAADVSITAGDNLPAANANGNDVDIRTEGDIILRATGDLRLFDIQAGSATNDITLCMDNAGGSFAVRTSTAACTDISSKRYKHDIQDLGSGLDIVNKLRPVSFVLNKDNRASVGFVAEEVEQIDNRLVFYNADDPTLIEGVRYSIVTSYLAKAIQELDQKIDGLVFSNGANPELFKTKTLLTDLIKPNSGSDVALQLGSDGRFVIKNDKDEEVASIDDKGNANFKGTITADKIKANQIEGIEVITDKVTSLSQKVANLTATTPAPESANALDLVKLARSSDPALAQQLSTEENQVLGSQTSQDTSAAQEDVALSEFTKATSEGTLAIDKPVEFKAKSIFSAIVEFISNVIFHGDVTFLGRPTFNKDTAGFAQIKEGAKQVRITFEKEYASTPVVTANAIWDIDEATLSELTQKEMYLLQKQDFIVAAVNTKGFTIVLEQAAIVDLKFSWNALAVQDGSTTLSTGEAGQAQNNAESTSQPSSATTPTSAPGVSSSLSEPEASRSASLKTITVKENELGFLRVREESNADSEEVGKVDPGQTFEVLEEENGWYKIEYADGKTGWVSGAYVSTDE